MDGMVYASTEHLDGWTPPTYVNPEAALPTNMKFPKGSNKCNELGEQVTEFYYGQETPSRRNLVKYSKVSLLSCSFHLPEAAAINYCYILVTNR